MKVKDRRAEKTVNFSELKAGDVFKIFQEYYIKTMTITHDGCEYGGVRLTDGFDADFNPETVVIVVDGYFVVE